MPLTNHHPAPPAARTLVGRVSVDTGQIIVTDPGYVLSGEYETDTPYGRACTASSGENLAGQMSVGGHATAVVSQSGHGDGSYPVYVEYNGEGRVARLTVEFLERPHWADAAS